MFLFCNTRLARNASNFTVAISAPSGFRILQIMTVDHDYFRIALDRKFEELFYF